MNIENQEPGTGDDGIDEDADERDVSLGQETPPAPNKPTQENTEEDADEDADEDANEDEGSEDADQGGEELDGQKADSEGADDEDDEDKRNKRRERRLRSKEERKRKIEAYEKLKNATVKEPKLEDFNGDEDEFKMARAIWRSKIDAKEEKIEEAKVEAQNAIAEENRVVIEEFTAQVKAAKKKYPDYDKVALGEHVQISRTVTQLIVSSEVGAEVAYFLGKNPAEAARISAMSPVDAAREIGRIEAKVTQQPMKEERRKTNATPPPTRVSTSNGGGGRTITDPARMSQKEYEQARREGRI